VFPVYCKKIDSIRTKLTEEIQFEVCHSGNLPPIVACSAAAVDDRVADPEMLRPHHSVRGFWPQIRELGAFGTGAQSGRKSQPACVHYCDFLPVLAKTSEFLHCHGNVLRPL